MEEVNDGGGAVEVSDEEGWVMERGAVNAGGLWEKPVGGGGGGT